MKINKRQLKRIIREEREKINPSNTNHDFGSNAERNKSINEYGMPNNDKLYVSLGDMLRANIEKYFQQASNRGELGPGIEEWYDDPDVHEIIHSVLNSIKDDYRMGGY